MDFAEKTAFHHYRPATLLRVTGTDANSFLQGQFTNELRGGHEGGAVYGLWLNQKGKVLADSFIMKWEEDGAFLIASYFSRSTVIRGRLDAYVIADDVMIEDATAAWAGISVIGPGADAWLKKPLCGAFAFHGRRTGGENVEWLFPLEREAEISAAIGLADRREVSHAEMEFLRITAGIPAVPRDIGPGELPNEGGLETSAISYTKGCYLGQEVMARLKSLGQVRRRLLRVTVAGGQIPLLPAPLFIGERKIGELRSALPDGAGNFVGLALLSLLHLKSDVALAFAPDTAPVVRLTENP